MNRLLVLLNFYKEFIFVYLVVTVIVGMINPNYAAAIVTKLFLTGFAWYFTTETTHKRKLTFYKNLGISPLILFSLLFVIDSILTIIYIFLIK